MTTTATTLPGATAPPQPARALRRSRLSWANPGWIVVGTALVLSLVGMEAIRTVEPDLAGRQGVFLGLALVAGAVAAAMPPTWLRRLTPLVLVLTGLLLVFVLIPWVPEAIVRPRNGARRWINLGVFDLQPSELAKIAYAMSMAAWLRRRTDHRRVVGLLVPIAITVLPMALIAVEPDLGTAMLFVPAGFAMLAAAGAKLRHLVLGAVLGLAMAPPAYFVLQDHQRQRVDALWYQLIGDDRHVQGIGYQGDKAIMLSAAGGFTGVGAERTAALMEANHLPERHNDMIFAVIALRWGAVGAGVLWLVYLVQSIGGLLVAARARDPFVRVLAVGLVTVVFCQMLVNAGMTIGMMFITGMNLPFVSYGGSSLISAWVIAGLLLGAGLRRPASSLAREAFAFDGDHA